MSIKIQNINGCRIAYQVEGETHKETLVFIHGFPFNQSMWQHQVEFFKNNYRIVTYDVRGHGNSESGTTDFSIALFANDLIHLLDYLKIEKAIVCGLSMGGYIALHTITRFPERFKGLVLCDTSCKADTDEGKLKREQTKNVIRQKGTSFYAAQSIPNLFAEISLKKIPDEVERFQKMITDTPENVLEQTLTALANRSATCDTLQKINIPTLIIVGEEDKLTPVEAAKNMANQLHSLMMCTVKNAGHISNVEQPDVVNTMLDTYLKSYF